MDNDDKNKGGRPATSKNKLTIQLNDWFERSLIGAESEFEEHPVMRLLRIGYDLVDAYDDKGLYSHVPVAVQTKALSEAMKYIRSPAASKLELTGKDGTPITASANEIEDIQKRLLALSHQINAQVVSEQ